MKDKIAELLKPVMEQEDLFQINFGFKKPLSNYTVLTCMKGMGFQYYPERKSYMINIYEKESVILN